MKATPMLSLRCSRPPLFWTQRLFGRTESIGHRRSSGRLLLAPAGFGALLLLFQAFAPASAAPPCTWNPGSGSWDNAANWTTCNGTYPGTGPSAGANANVVNGEAVLTTGNLGVGTLTIGNSSYGGVEVIGRSATHDNFASVAITHGNRFVLTNDVSLTTIGALTMNGGMPKPILTVASAMAAC
ncbi:MAG: hypothetical protein ABI386_12625 [Rhodanobacter sp.]